MPQRESHRRYQPLPFVRSLWVTALVAGWLAIASSGVAAVSLNDLQQLYRNGEYAECLKLATENLEQNQHSQYWRVMLVKAHLAIGDTAGAQAALDAAKDRFSRSLQLNWLQYELASARGDKETAQRQIKEIDDYAGPRLRYLQDPENLVLLGKAALVMGAEPKLVLDNFFVRAQKADPDFVDAWLAAGDLALDKHDFELAAKTFQGGLDQIPDHPDLLYGLAQSYAPSDRQTMLVALLKALETNTNHVPSHLLLADHLIDAEDYEAAQEQLDLALAVNPNRPEAWAYKAVIAHVQNKPGVEQEAREKALAPWPGNPLVDHLIGRKLSLKYRFKEGAEHQRAALAMEPDYLPARIQLAQDLLRLGEDEEGWQLADAVHQQDGYDVTAFNLVTLRDQYKRFATLTNEHFIVRMEAREADVFGNRVLALLSRAHATMTNKYGVQLERPTLVEIFSDPRDFAVRTFGMPGNPGYLGVCFGDVVTANSPTSPSGNAASWESVLWHEYCHVVTLNMTRNKMPRWLSEGISVYEELAEDPSWGQRMNPEYRELILNGKMKPVSELSSAFLTADSNVDLQFAYYQSALVVQYLVEKHGFDSLKSILNDLGRGVSINDAISAHAGSIDTVDQQFADYAKELARETGRGLVWKKPEVKGAPFVRMSELLARQPSNYWVLVGAIEEFIAAQEWSEAADVLEILFDKGSGTFQTAKPYLLQAAVLARQQDGAGAIEALKKAAAVDGNQIDVFQQLLDHAREEEDWAEVYEQANRVISMNPMLLSAYRSLAESAEQLDRNAEAIEAWETMLKLEPLNPALAHYSAARLQFASAPQLARRHLLFALEEAPRFRDAHRLLLQIEALQTNTPAVQENPATETDGVPAEAATAPEPPAEKGGFE